MYSTENVFFTFKGEEGVSKVLKIFKEELKITMKLCGMVIYNDIANLMKNSQIGTYDISYLRMGELSAF